MTRLLAVLVACVLLSQTAVAQQFPSLTDRVVDAADIIPPAVETKLTRMLAEHEKTTDNQVVVVTVPDLQGYDIADFGYRLGRHWGIGQKGKDNGLLFIIAPTERKLRIEVGYGLEGDMPDATAKSIIDTVVVPAFKKGDMGGGIESGVLSILSVLRDGDWTAPKKPDNGPSDMPVTFFILILFISFAIIAFINHRTDKMLGRRHRRNRHAWGTMGGFGGRSSGGGFSSGGFSGGGGSFGGGGASGGW